MPASTDPKIRREAALEFRRLMRSQGLRPVVIWVPDPGAPGFEAEARRQARAIAESPQEAEDQAWVDSVSIWPDA